MHIHYIQDMDLFELNHGDNVFVFTRRDNHLYVTAQDITLADEIFGPFGERVYCDLAYVDHQPIFVSIDEYSSCILAYDLKGSKALFLDTASCCNFVPTESTGARSPREIFTGAKLDFSIQLRAQFGEFVFVKTPWTSAKTPDHAPRAEAGLIVGRDLNSKGGVKINSLSTTQPLPEQLYSDDDEDPDLDPEPVISPSDAITRTAPPLPGTATSDFTDDDLFQPVDSQSSGSVESTSDTEPSTARGARRYSLRPNRSSWKNAVFNLTVKKALELYGDLAEASMIQEVTQMVQMEVWELTKRNQLSTEAIKRIIPCSLFLKEKLFPDGTFEKLKARLVAGGHRQDPTLYDS
eukprot:gene23086-24436_t